MEIPYLQLGDRFFMPVHQALGQNPSLEASLGMEKATTAAAVTWGTDAEMGALSVTSGE